MRAVLIDSPGSSAEPHWSGGLVASLAAELERLDVGVSRLPGTVRPPVALHRVNASLTDVSHEIALTEALRADPAHAVVHAGVGACGSPNLLWIAARMGSAAVAVVRAEEVVCHRGDLVDRTGARCQHIDDPGRCAWCCSRSFWRRAPADAFRNRFDLVVAGLQACSTVWIPEGDDIGLLERVGVPRRLVSTAAPGDLVARVAADVRALAAAFPAG